MQKEDKIMKWMLIIVIAVALSLNGCAETADAEDSPTTTPTETQEETKTNAVSGTAWVAIVMTWNPVIYTIDKECSTELDC